MSMETCQSSGQIAVGTTVVISRPCKVFGVSLLQAAAGCSATVYDSSTTTTSGKTVVITVSNATNATTASSLQLAAPVECLQGATVTVAGTGAQAIIYYSPL